MVPTDEALALIAAFLALYPTTKGGPGHPVLADLKLSDADIKDTLGTVEVVRLQRMGQHPFKDEGTVAALDGADWYNTVPESDLLATQRVLLLLLGVPEARRWV